MKSNNTHQKNLFYDPEMHHGNSWDCIILKINRYEVDTYIQP